MSKLGSPLGYFQVYLLPTCYVPVALQAGSVHEPTEHRRKAVLLRNLWVPSCQSLRDFERGVLKLGSGFRVPLIRVPYHFGDLERDLDLEN